MKEKTILIFTNSEEMAVKQVIQYFKEMNQDYLYVDTEEFANKGGISLRLSNEILEGHIHFNGITFELSQIKSIWHRRVKNPKFTKLGEQINKFIEDEYRTSLWSFYTAVNAFWMNPPLIAIRLLEHNKLYQLKEASVIGLGVPATIITNNPKELLSFCRKHKKAVVKTLRPAFICEKDDKVLGVYTNPISEKQIIDHFDDIKLAPVLVQQYIEKKIELRITIVGDKIFACAIYSQDSEKTKHDWRRYDFENVKHEPYKLPNEIEDKLLCLMEKWQLSFGAIDMILTPDNEYVFLEVNPSGQYAWIEGMTGMPISKTIAETLANPPRQCHFIL